MSKTRDERVEETPAETWEAIDQTLQIARGTIEFAQWIGKVTWTVEKNPASRRALADAFLGLQAEALLAQDKAIEVAEKAIKLARQLEAGSQSRGTTE
jgi:hypothetical protein